LRRLARWCGQDAFLTSSLDAFDPTEPAILHDLLSDRIITWTAEQADDYRRASRPRDDGTVAWKAYVFDGWGNVLGG
jgi:hypothetical protein